MEKIMLNSKITTSLPECMTWQPKKLIRVLLLGFSICNFGDHVSAQEKRVPFIGKIIHATEKTPVLYSLIVNKSTRESAVSDSLGFFNIRVSAGDTLYISRIGYYFRELSINYGLLHEKKIHIIELNEKISELTTVTINTLGSYQDFRYKVIHSELPKEKEQINPEIAKAFNEKVVVLQPQASIPLGSPITAIYMMVSKEGKSLRKLEKLKEQERKVLSYSDKYNSQIVSRITGLKELELEKFMKYCNPDINFIMNSTEVDITAKILECLKTSTRRKQSRSKTKCDFTFF